MQILDFVLIKIQLAILSIVSLILSWRSFIPYRNQFIYLQGKPIDWFLHDRDDSHERVKRSRDFQ